MITKLPLALVLAVSTTAAVSAKDYVLHSFKKTQLTDKFWSEGANYGDFNHDGKMDVVSGPYWYEGPDFLKRHEYAPATKTFKRKKTDGSEEVVPGFEGALGLNNAYSDNFLAYTYDFNNDGWTDILILGFPGEISAWYENPQGREGHWQKRITLDVTDNESPTFTDITGDGKPEIVCSSKGSYGYSEPDRTDATKPWKFHAISPNNNYHKFTHGLGVGDVNGDGQMDLLEKDGWWEHPASLAGDPVWKYHKQNFGTGGAQMYAYDVNGDGLNDVITCIAAHGYGLVWYEQVRQSGESTFKEHIILNKQTEKDQRPLPDRYGVIFSQPHAIDLIDMDGDGLKDIVTGKRFWAHGAHGDVEPNAPAVVYWFQLVRGANHTAEFIPHLIDNDSGVGTQVVAGDINGDQTPDIVIGNKKGTFVLIHHTAKVSEEEWQKAQPKRTSGAAGR